MIAILLAATVIGIALLATAQPFLNVYHFLRDQLEYNPELDERYREYVDEVLLLNLASAGAFVNSLNGVAGIYGEGCPLTVNTYNGMTCCPRRSNASIGPMTAHTFSCKSTKAATQDAATPLP